MNKINIFAYEHIGHMQISVLTLELYNAIFEKNKNNYFNAIEINDVRNTLINKGFPPHIVDSEIERFFYGFECIKFLKNKQFYMSLTPIGINYINEIKKNISNQSSQFAFIIKNSRRKNSINVIIQETTFFDRNIYRLIKEYKFRSGGARDFLRCIPIDEFIEFISKVIKYLNIAKTNNVNTSINECINIINSNGKYWSGVASKYSWIIFKQKYQLNFSKEIWRQYDFLMEYMKRPIEWGGNAKDISKESLLENEVDIMTFLKNGILRKLYSNSNDNYYRLTAPGFLMYERKQNGFLLEIMITKYLDYFNIDICEATDKENYFIYSDNKHLLHTACIKNQEVISYLKDNIIYYKNKGVLF